MMTFGQLESQQHRRLHSSANENSGFSSSSRVPKSQVVGTREQPRESRKISSKDESGKMKRNQDLCFPLQRLLGKSADKPSTIDKTMIGNPIPLIAQQAPPRPARPHVGEGLFAFPAHLELEANPVEPRIDRGNLGSANDALHSHPIEVILEGQIEAFGPDREMDIKTRHRKFKIYNSSNDEDVSIGDTMPLRGLPASSDLLPERRRSRTYSKAGSERKQYTIFGPDAWDVVQETRRDGNNPDSKIPTIQLPPPEDEGEKKKKKKKQEIHLKPLALMIAETEGIDINDFASLAEKLREILDDRKRLENILPLANTICEAQGINVNDSASLAEKLKEILEDRKRLEDVMPLANIATTICETEGIEVNDFASLAEKLREILDDRKRLEDVLPLANTICEAQGINLNIESLPEALGRAFQDVVDERDRALFVAGYHKKVRRTLESRIYQLEKRLSLLSGGEEENHTEK